MASLKTIFSKVDAWFKKVLGSEASWERTATVTLSVAAPLLETAVTLTAGEPAGAVVQEVITQIQNDLAAAQQLIAAAGPTPSIASFLNSASTNLDSVVTSAQIKDPTTQTKVESVVQTVIGEIKAILAVLPA